ncbi:MarR family winged helix-turn-helix transcriptional regulator [Leucobacter sp. G161]|uniref:MarR family winged helix-turn-helix transcriptional regulator n=1 Tax=Leucobacter sp. G161 TaxID=663704 RepID=UPI00073BF686|nr:MarR family transcriptional regulator [Leucobacter sp. G161]KUF06352.1 hypothetical protein AUL38_02615 [Leucobacter sp. G161]
MSASDDHNQQLMLALRHLRTVIRSRDRAIAETAHVREGDLNVLEVLHREGPQSPTALAELTGTHLATMTGVLTRLERGGWLERRPVVGNRRTIQIHQTSVERFEKLYAAVSMRLSEVFGGWSGQKREAFVGAIDEVAAALGDPPTRV